MTIPEALIEAAWRRGARHCFGVPGSGALMDLIDAGRRRGVEFVSTANEASAAIAAAYYGHLRGCAGLALAIKGPGAGNLVGGAVNAYFERKPVVCITEALPEAFVPVEMGQRIDQSGLFRTAAKQTARLVPAAAGTTIDAAFDSATTGRPGPVLLDLPGDLGGAEAGPAAQAAPQAASTPPTATDAPAVAAAAAVVAEMRRPVIIAAATCCAPVHRMSWSGWRSGSVRRCWWRSMGEACWRRTIPASPGCSPVCRRPRCSPTGCWRRPTE